MRGLELPMRARGTSSDPAFRRPKTPSASASPRILLMAIIGSTDLAANLGNIVTENRTTGIEASGVVVAGNVITGTENGWGLSIDGGPPSTIW